MTLKEMRGEIKIETRSMQKQAKNTKRGEYIEEKTVCILCFMTFFKTTNEDFREGELQGRDTKPGWEGGEQGMVAEVVVARMKCPGSSQRVGGK